MNKTVISIVTAVILAVGILVGLGYVQPFFGANAFEDYSGVSQDDFLAYRNELGFEISYPQSFRAVESPDPSSPIRVSFSASGRGIAEVVEITVASENVQSLTADTIDSLDSQERKTLSQGKAFGKATVISFEKEIAGEKITVRLHYFECPSYNAILTSLIPVSLKQDLKMVNYMASTFKC
ncbi:MAG: hypothetical protein QXR53_01740 [Candidatus Norongarragalinales archaeon]